MPTNFADLPTDEPFPNGKVQFKRGTSDTFPTVNTSTAIGSILAQSPSISTGVVEYPCLWVVRANVLADSGGVAGGWRRWDWGIRISPADVNGEVVGIRVPCLVNESVAWRSYHGQFIFRLAAGTNYTASLTHEYMSAVSARYLTGPLWYRIMGRMVMMGVL